MGLGVRIITGRIGDWGRTAGIARALERQPPSSPCCQLPKPEGDRTDVAAVRAFGDTRTTLGWPLGRAGLRRRKVTGQVGICVALRSMPSKQ